MTAQKTNQNVRHKALFNTISNYLGKFVSLFTWFFLTPFILHQLGDDTYGLWALIGSIVAYGTLLDFGIAGAVTKYVAEYQATGETDKAHHLVATALSLYTAIGIGIVVISGLLAPWLPTLFTIAPENHSTAVWLLFLSGLGVGVSIPCATTTAVLRGLQRFDLVNIISGSSTLLQAGAVVAVLLAGGGVLGLAIIVIVVRLLMQLPAIWFIYRVAPELRFGWRGARRESVRTVASFSWAIFLVHLGGHLEAKTDEIVIGTFLPIRAVAPYSIAQKLSLVPQMITEQFLVLILPLASELYAVKDFTRLRKLYLSSTRLTLAIFLPIACCLMILAAPLLKVWVGQAYVPYAPLVVILVLATLIDTILWPAGFVLQGMTRHKVPAFMALGSGVVNLFLSIFLVQRLGVVGVALGTLIPTTIVAFFFVLPYTMWIIEVNLKTAVTQIYLPALLPGLPLVLAVYYLNQVYQPASFISLGLVSIVGLLIYLFGYLIVGAGELEREACKDALSIIHNVARTYFNKLAHKQLS